jgi:hypothetical protein
VLGTTGAARDKEDEQDNEIAIIEGIINIFLK